MKKYFYEYLFCKKQSHQDLKLSDYYLVIINFKIINKLQIAFSLIKKLQSLMTSYNKHYSMKLAKHDIRQHNIYERKRPP